MRPIVQEEVSEILVVVCSSCSVDYDARKGSIDGQYNSLNSVQSSSAVLHVEPVFSRSPGVRNDIVLFLQLVWFEMMRRNMLT